MRVDRFHTRGIILHIAYNAIVDTMLLCVVGSGNVVIVCRFINSKKFKFGPIQLLQEKSFNDILSIIYDKSIHTCLGVRAPFSIYIFRLIVLTLSIHFVQSESTVIIWPRSLSWFWIFSFHEKSISVILILFPSLIFISIPCSLFTIHGILCTFCTLHSTLRTVHTPRHIPPGWQWWYYQLNSHLFWWIENWMPDSEMCMILDFISIQCNSNRLVNGIHLACNELYKFALFKRMKRNFIVVWIRFVDFLFFKANQTNERIF